MSKLLADVVDPPLVPGSPEWCREVTASKVSAILGLSPWTSRFTVWHELAGQLPHDDLQTVNQARGHYLEEAVAQWFVDEYRVHLRPGRCWRSKVYPWMVVSPDRLVVAHRNGRKPVSVVEIKTAADYGDWGPDGSDDVPPHYRTQVIVQLDALGLPVGYLAALLPRLALRAYRINYDPEEAAWIREQVTEFMATLPGGPNEQVPDIDESDSTYETVRRLHPEIEDREVEVPEELGRRLLDSVDMAKAADSALVGVKSEVAVLMGTAQRAVVPVEGDKPLVIATRQAKGGGNPYVAPSRSQQVRTLLGV